MKAKSSYSFREIEEKWQRRWQETGLYRTDMSKTEKKLYCLVMFLYPSADKLHIGHWYNYGPTDSWARFKRMQGYNVFEPMGYDAFGLPAENYAIKKGVHPAISTAENIRFIRKQLERIGAMYDWDKEIDTSSPRYYKWTQWFFLKLYEHGLAYRAKAPVNWCPQCKTVLANEQVIDGRCERCSTEVTRRDLEQWFFRITDYAERLLQGHEKLQWPEKTIIMQRNWIGRSEGAQISFTLKGHDEVVEVFTTRPDTLFGATYMVLAPEHPLVERITSAEQRPYVTEYVEACRRKSEIERTSTEKEKTGVFTGAYAINPINGQEIPVWIADYVLLSYGTGAVMAVPAHDQRDYEFAVKFGLPIVQVILPTERTQVAADRAYEGPGSLINSGPFSGMDWKEGGRAIVETLKRQGRAEFKVTYRLRDWLVSRQRYWGAPIPIVYCNACGIVPVPEKDLPVLLPENVTFTGQGESPLATVPEFVNTMCPRCGGPARREVDTMDTFVCSSWYFLRFPNPHVDDKPFDPEVVEKWLPVDQYVGGAEHAVMHLLYARFFTMALKDMGLIKFEEPFLRLVHQGTITNRGAKMSKSRGNVVNPETYLDRYGSDAFRMFMMFMGDYTEGGDWSDEGIAGVHRFLNRVWRLVQGFCANPPQGDEKQHSSELLHAQHRTVQAVTQDLERFHFNTAISRLMEFVSALYGYVEKVPVTEQNRSVLTDAIRTLIQCLAPFAPHLGEELWEQIGGTYSVFDSGWPKYDERLAARDTVTVVFQVNGKLRSSAVVKRGLPEEELRRLALEDQRVRKFVGDKSVRRVVVVRDKLVNVVAG
ncbi:MAG: leucine--tRNA ligase [candidate division KSB1 bacterium]|nr:leucine--tRNA ligase [candidate division KSB1 bacterium]